MKLQITIAIVFPYISSNVLNAGKEKPFLHAEEAGAWARKYIKDHNLPENTHRLSAHELESP